MPTKQQQEDRIKELEKQINELKEELRQLKTSEIVSNEVSSSRFFPKPIPNWQKNLVIGTSRIKHLKSNWVGATVHSYRGATIDELADVISRYQKKKLSQVIIIGGFNDHHQPNVQMKWDQLIRAAKERFSPSTLIVPQTISTTDDEIARSIKTINEKLCNAISENHCDVFSPDINAILVHNGKFFGNIFTADGIHLSYHGNRLLTALLQIYFHYEINQQRNVATNQYPANRQRNVATNQYPANRQYHRTYNPYTYYSMNRNNNFWY